MSLTNDQIAALLKMITVAEPADLDCDGCFDRLAEFAETELANQEIPAALQAVETHIKQCTCCQDEYATLLEGLRELDQS